MPSTVEPRSGLFTFDGFASGDGGWATELIANTLIIGRFGFQLSVLDRDITDPGTLTPSAGDCYIVDTSAIGDWAAHDDEVAIYDGTDWVFGVPRIGWVAYVEDEEVLTAFKSGGWSAGISI